MGGVFGVAGWRRRGVCPSVRWRLVALLAVAFAVALTLCGSASASGLPEIEVAHMPEIVEWGAAGRSVVLQRSLRRSMGGRASGGTGAGFLERTWALRDGANGLVGFHGSSQTGTWKRDLARFRAAQGRLAHRL